MWKFLDGLEGNATLAVYDEDVGHLKRGEWRYLQVARVGKTTDGDWLVARSGTTWGDEPTATGTSALAMLLHDTAGGWRLLVPHGFEPREHAAKHDVIWVTDVHQTILLSRKVKLIFAAEPPHHAGIE